MFTIIVHDGRFHADEVLATAIIKLYFQATDPHAEFEIVRTRDANLIKEKSGENTFVVDVGRVYDEDLHRFDHHQESCAETYDPVSDERGEPILLSSCGMVFKYLARAQPSFLEAAARKWVCSGREDKMMSEWDPSPEELESLHRAFYYRFIASIDANDNGISQYSRPKTWTELVVSAIVDRFAPTLYKPLYREGLTIGQFISSLNGPDVNDANDQLSRFEAAVTTSEIELKSFLIQFMRIKIEHTQNLGKISKVNRDDGFFPEIIVLEEEFNHEPAIKELSKHDDFDRTKFVVLPRGQNQWQVHTISTVSRFERRADLIPPEEAEKLLGKDYVFVHKGLFIGVTNSKESAIMLAARSLGAARENHGAHPAPKPSAYPPRFFVSMPFAWSSWTPWAFWTKNAGATPQSDPE